MMGPLQKRHILREPIASASSAGDPSYPMIETSPLATQEAAIVPRWDNLTCVVAVPEFVPVASIAVSDSATAAAARNLFSVGATGCFTTDASDLAASSLTLQCTGALGGGYYAYDLCTMTQQTPPAAGSGWYYYAWESGITGIGDATLSGGTATFSITAVSTGANTVSISSTVDPSWTVGGSATIAGSTANDGTYTVAAVAYDADTDVYTVTLTESLVDGTADGTITSGGPLLVPAATRRNTATLLTSYDAVAGRAYWRDWQWNNANTYFVRGSSSIVRITTALNNFFTRFMAQHVAYATLQPYGTLALWQDIADPATIYAQYRHHSTGAFWRGTITGSSPSTSSAGVTSMPRLNNITSAGINYQTLASATSLRTYVEQGTNYQTY